MKKIFLIPAVIFAFALVTGCNGGQDPLEPQEEAPPMVTGVTATGLEGSIEISWTNPSQGTFSYVQIDYTDPKTSADKTQKVNPPATSWQLTDLTSEDGEVSFKVFTVAPKGTESATFATVKATALDPVIAPAAAEMVTGITATPAEGSIELAWTYPIGHNISYLEISFTDPREGENKGKVVSQRINAPMAEYTVENLYKKYGEITFTFTTYTTKGTPCKTEDIKTIKATSLRVPGVNIEIETQITLSDDNVSCAQVSKDEGTNGPVAKMFDNDPGTYYHSPYGGTPTVWPVDFDITLTEGVDLFKFVTQLRAGNKNSHPGIIEIFVSNDGTNWGDAIATYAQGEVSGKFEDRGPFPPKKFDATIHDAEIPTEGGAIFTPPVAGTKGTKYTHIRFRATSAPLNQWNEDGDSFSIAEMKLFSVRVEFVDNDPE